MSHDAACIFQTLCGWRRQSPLFVVDVQAADGGAVLLLEERPPTHQPLKLPVCLLLGYYLKHIVELVQFLLGVISADESPCEVMARHVGIWAVFAILIGAIAHIEDVAVYAHQLSPARRRSLLFQLLQRERAQWLLKILWKPHGLRPGHRPVTLRDRQALGGLVIVLLQIQRWLRHLCCLCLERRILLPVEAEEHLFLRLPLSLRHLGAQPRVERLFLWRLL
mmetsp:Transcript_49397/g.138968  ORF Transcript_49397/g.138968 Transcript_49397/m.138968 type:complete len:222 (+) Transcript_49397:78-743(+)